MSALPLTQNVTYWAAGASDKNGTPTYGAPITIKARWVRKDGIVTDKNGDKQKTEFVIYAVVTISKRSKVVFGTDVSATPPTGSREIVGNIENPSLTNLVKHVA